MFGLFRRNNSSRAAQMARIAIENLEKSNRVLKKRVREINLVQRQAQNLLMQLKVITETTADDIESCQKRIAYADKAVEALRTEHEIDAECTIPTFAKRIKELEAACEEKIAVSHHRRAMATPTPIEREL